MKFQPECNFTLKIVRKTVKKKVNRRNSCPALKGSPFTADQLTDPVLFRYDLMTRVTGVSRFSSEELTFGFSVYRWHVRNDDISDVILIRYKCLLKEIAKSVMERRTLTHYDVESVDMYWNVHDFCQKILSIRDLPRQNPCEIVLQAFERLEIFREVVKFSTATRVATKLSGHHAPPESGYRNYF